MEVLGWGGVYVPFLLGFTFLGGKGMVGGSPPLAALNGGPAGAVGRCCESRSVETGRRRETCWRKASTLRQAPGLHWETVSHVS